MTYKELYLFGRNKLEEAGIAEFEIDARLLLEFVCKTDRSFLYAHPDSEVTDIQEKDYVNHINTRMQRIPLQHITETQDFMGLEFYVNQDVLIPRQDTEILVEEVMQKLHDGMEILDVCTGSGCILLSLLHYSNDCKGVGVDLSDKALEVARKNQEKLGGNASFVESNLFEKVEGQFDILVSNPPYIRSDVIETLMPEVSCHEPRMALDGYEDGLYFYREIAKNASNFLRHFGYLFFEIGYDQGQDVKDILEQNGFSDVKIIKDLAGLDRVVRGKLGGLKD